MDEAVVAKMIAEAMAQGGGQQVSMYQVVIFVVIGTYAGIHIIKQGFDGGVRLLNAKNGTIMPRTGEDSSVTRRECDKCSSNLIHRMEEAKEDRSLLRNEIQSVDAKVDAVPERVVALLKPRPIDGVGGG